VTGDMGNETGERERVRALIEGSDEERGTRFGERDGSDFLWLFR
jgi:hypothetical protein